MIANRGRTARLSTGEAARLLGYCPAWIRHLIKSGELPASRPSGGHYRIDREEIERRLASPAQKERVI